MKLSKPMRTALLLLAEDGDWRDPYRHRNLSKPTFDALVSRGLATRSTRSGNYRITGEGDRLVREYRNWQDNHARLDGAVIEARRLYEGDGTTDEEKQAAWVTHRLLVNKRNALDNPITIA